MVVAWRQTGALQTLYIFVTMHIIPALQDWWHQQTWYEIIGFITGILCVALAAFNNIWNWPIAIISVGFYIYIYYQKHLFADTGLQVYFLLMNVYGWYYWSKAPATEEKAPIMRITERETIYSIIATIVFTVFLGSVLKYTSASFPYLDSFCAAVSLVAQVLLARKVLENWLIWTFVDIIYVGILIFKHLDLTAILYGIYVPLAIWGYFDWRKDYRKQLLPTQS